MADKGTRSEKAGSGLLPAGVILALLFGAAALLALQRSEQLETVDTTLTDQSDPPSPTDAEVPPAEFEAVPTEDQIADVPQETEPVERPSVDEVRVDGAGTMVVAGRGDPGSTVDVLLDGEVVASAKVDTRGAFAALTSIPTSDAARSLTLRSDDGEDVVASEEEIILAPVAPDPSLPRDPGTQVAAAKEDTAVQNSDVEDGSNPGTALRTEVPAENLQTSRSNTDEPSDAASEIEAASDGEKVDAITQKPTALDNSDTKTETGTASVDRTAALENKDAASKQERGRQIAVIRSDAQGVELLRPPLAATETVVLDTIGYDDTGGVQLGGRANSDAAQVRAYLNNRLAAELQVGPDGDWRGDLPNVAPGVYTLRIDAVTADGRVSSRIETPFKRETADVLAAATAASTGAGTARAVTVQAGDTLWAIARERYGEGLLYVQVFEANRGAIRNPDLIYPGQVFDLPDN